jgi:alpha-L-rhamnosidase
MKGRSLSKPTRLRAEHLDGALGIGDRRPRLSWRLPGGADREKACELALDDGTTVHVAADDCVLVPWPGRPLKSGERREVRARVWTDLGQSEWSDPLAVEAGLLDPSDLRIFTPDEGATEHVGLDHLPHVGAFTADWIGDTFAELA